ncbi:MAG TPA: isocitrate lyase/phosphoenolpyruvate mutase family protein [Devosia sp.]|nr:isocitrate lyase/phosphoenolpyruvate mutase family protein [Devosia sp.]
MSVTSFRELHRPGEPFVLANAWDLGSAKVLAALGAKALATTSAGHAFTLGLKDMGEITREQSLEHAGAMAKCTSLPVSGDLENGYGHGPEEVARTVKLAHQSGLAGCCIEDIRLPSAQPYEFAVSVARIEAAVETARQLVAKTGRDFVLTARADGVMHGQYDTNEAIRRLRAYEAAGADVLYAPMPPSMDELARICRELSAPVNALAAGSFASFSVGDFANIGVARISLGSALARLTHATLVNSARQFLERGDFSSFREGMDGAKIEAMFDKSG